jgi:sarcosine oxidase
MESLLNESSSSDHYDAIVIGVGSMGSSACWHLAGRGFRVLGIEQFAITHEHGSHTGQTRIIRKAYFEHPDYVPLLHRAYHNWKTFEKIAGSSVYHRTGIVYFGKPDNENIKGILNSARLYQIPVEHGSADGVGKKFPAFRIPPDFYGVVEPDAGFVTPENAIRLYVEQSVVEGATINTGERVHEWKPEGQRIKVFTDKHTYTCDKLIITAGAWTSKVVPALPARLHVTRQLLAWVRPPRPQTYSLGNFPCWFVEDPERGTFYGFPIVQEQIADGPIGLKLAHHYPGETADPDQVQADFPAEADETIRYFLRTYLPDAGDDIISVKSCLYTYSDDTHFIIDHLPGYHNRVTVACGFSGHGFKFVSVVGEILADLAMNGNTNLPIEFLRLDRFNRPPSPTYTTGSALQ